MIAQRWRKPALAAGCVILLIGGLFVMSPPAGETISALLAQPKGPSGGASEQTSEDGQHRHTNHLIDETSPYLRQHAHNPVNWYPWGEEAFQKAEQENKLIFLSVGYSTCHWCHVMARKCFENEEIAAILNKHYVAIKVDREQRPAVDEQYMLATQILTGSGGWPNSVWLTPDRKPFTAGTYIPPAQFKDALKRMAQQWETRRQAVLQQAERVSQSVEEASSGDRFAVGRPVSQQLVDQAVDSLRQSFDQKHGGFGGAPKFPPHSSLQVLIHEYRRTENAELLTMIERTLDGMARGGIRDHVGGGFHRYSTDGRWFLPHFEKMLYDNALFLRNYTDGYLLTGDERYRRVVVETFGWLQRLMQHPKGGFYSALNSESEGEEGAYYVWTYQELENVLGAEDARLFADVYGFQEQGNYREEATGQRTGANVVYLPAGLGRYAEQNGWDRQRLRKRLAAMRKELLQARLQRQRPSLDDKVLTGWNGLTISALAYAGRQLDQSEYTRAAEKAATFIWERMFPDGQLLRTFRLGQAEQPAYLSDYAFLGNGLLELYWTTGDDRWLQRSQKLAETIQTEFEDKSQGGFFFTSRQHQNLLLRSKNLFGGGNTPSPNGAATQFLVRLGRLTGEERYNRSAERALEALSGFMGQSPQQADSLIRATALSLAKGSVEPPPTASSEKAADLPKPDLRHEKHPITANVYASRLKVNPGQGLQLAVLLEIADGWHLYGPNPDNDVVIPSTVKIKNSNKLMPEKLRRPEGKTLTDPVLQQKLTVYEGRVWFRLPVKVASDAEPGPMKLKLALRTQACDESRCLPPRKTTLKLPLRVISGEQPEANRHRELFRSITKPR